MAPLQGNYSEALPVQQALVKRSLKEDCKTNWTDPVIESAIHMGDFFKHREPQS